MLELFLYQQNQSHESKKHPKPKKRENLELIFKD